MAEQSPRKRNVNKHAPETNVGRKLHINACSRLELDVVGRKHAARSTGCSANPPTLIHHFNVLDLIFRIKCDFVVLSYTCDTNRFAFVA
jgi:hypothetical protein